MNLPKELKLSPHAKERLMERKDADVKYNIRNLMRSSIKWYNKDDLIFDSALYRHCCYTTRQSKQVGYITDGIIEVIYDKSTHVVITILAVKDKFKPITQYIKPDRINKKKENNMKTELKPIICTDCGKEVENINNHGVCTKCARRKTNMKSKGKVYIKYLDLSEEEKRRIDKAIEGQAKRHKKVIVEEPEPVLTIPNNENYYISKANQTEIETHEMIKPIQKLLDPLSDVKTFIKILQDNDCTIPEENLTDLLNVLINTNRLKSIFEAVTKVDSQQMMLNLEQTLTDTEKKLQDQWETNGFQKIDDIKFKGFLTWRRMLKDALCFWKNLYQTNTIKTIQNAWGDGVSNTDTVVPIEKSESDTKRFQITTDSISTIFNTRRPFSRVFYATDKEKAYDMFKQWMSDRNLHEDTKKTTIVELKD